MEAAANSDEMKHKSGYADVNGIKMYYEIYGEGFPLVLIHGGGSTIQTTFGRVIPKLAVYRQLICVELQAHGRTSDRDSELSFEQDADDVHQILNILRVKKADFFGFSNGGNTALQIAIRHPEMCRKIIAGSILLKREGTSSEFWEFMKNGTFDQMPQQYKDAFLRVTPDSIKLFNMYQKCASRMIGFQDFSDEKIKSINAPVLLVNGDADVASSEHIVQMSKLIPHCNLTIIPGAHGEYIGEITTIDSHKNIFPIIPLLIKFLDAV
ncbi:Pimeloyl-ACP methyl ester carboxylesterase [Dyadobacter koreensis]|uniref:Pimeloyl-ACP methyl ester carboxylesterase n=1 Tax=Dyadobacter koreensis TaxID=408657 RepID=A0A1H6QET3_9BACT|nr:alpha/beta hydrolase [Dyadobacter koreensis]SEI37725.1 Pimeloyl-ACP methyl ester carboxylesterase [Dyadobacter koreensis]